MALGRAGSATASTPARWSSTGTSGAPARRVYVRASPADGRYNRGVSDVAASEHELIRDARDGDHDAFAELVVIHAERVYGALRRFGLDLGEAEGVAQEGFL